MLVTRIAPHHTVTANIKFTFFQSYESVIVRRDNDTGEVLLSKRWNYSRTTLKYLGVFIGESGKVVRERVASGEYKIGIDTSGELL